MLCNSCVSFAQKCTALGIGAVMRPFYLVESRSQDAAANAGVLSNYLTTALYYNDQL